MEIKPLEPAPYGFPRDDLIASVAREIAMRKSCYPKWVESGKLKQKDAERELGLMLQVLELVKAVTYRDNAELAVGALWIELRKYMTFEKCFEQFSREETGIMQKNIAKHLRDVVYKSEDYDLDVDVKGVQGDLLEEAEPFIEIEGEDEDEGVGIL